MGLSQILLIVSLGYMVLAEYQIPTIEKYVKNILETYPNLQTRIGEEFGPEELAIIIAEKVEKTLNTKNQTNNDDDTEAMLLNISGTEMPENSTNSNLDFVTKAPEFDVGEELSTKAPENVAEINGKKSIEENVNNEDDGETSSLLQSIANPVSLSQDTKNTPNEVNNEDESMVEILRAMKERDPGVDEGIKTVDNGDESFAVILTMMKERDPGVDEEVKMDAVADFVKESKLRDPGSDDIVAKYVASTLSN